MATARSPFVAVLAIMAIVGSVFLARSCSKPGRSELREKVSWRACLNCGHMWQMDVAEIEKQRLRDPGGNRCVQCPQCRAWKGVPTTECAKCGKRIPRGELRAADGSIYFVERKYCDDCERTQGR
jgi:hypothetical protein